jgi:hypothetical protein
MTASGREDVRSASAAVRRAARLRDAAARGIAETVLAGARPDEGTLGEYRGLVAAHQEAWRTWQAAVDGWDERPVSGR